MGWLRFLLVVLWGEVEMGNLVSLVRPAFPTAPEENYVGRHRSYAPESSLVLRVWFWIAGFIGQRP